MKTLIMCGALTCTYLASSPAFAQDHGSHHAQADAEPINAMCPIGKEPIVPSAGTVEYKGKTIGILGLAFKPNTDDLRDAKSLEIIDDLKKKGAVVRVYDPVAMDNAKTILDGVTFCRNAYEVADGCDAVVVVTDWNEFKLLNMEKIRDAMKAPVLFDGRNVYSPDKLRKCGFEYFGIGR